MKRLTLFVQTPRAYLTGVVIGMLLTWLLLNAMPVMHTAFGNVGTPIIFVVLLVGGYLLSKPVQRAKRSH